MSGGGVEIMNGADGGMKVGMGDVVRNTPVTGGGIRCRRVEERQRGGCEGACCKCEREDQRVKGWKDGNESRWMNGWIVL